MDKKRFPFFMALCGIGVLLGAFLPWVTLKTPILSTSVKGVDGSDGKIVAALGIACAVLAWLLHAGKAGPRARLFTILCLVGFVLSGVVYVIDYADIKTPDMGGLGGFSVSHGIGMYLGIAASVVGAVLAVMRLRGRTSA